LAFFLCVKGGLRWPARLIRVIVVIIIATVTARWDPAAAVPLAAGSGLGAWVVSAGITAPPALVPAAAR
jgi:hypothetical protein